jgi:hypothetical protein
MKPTVKRRFMYSRASLWRKHNGIFVNLKGNRFREVG